jgi:uncharacterized protein (TIGR00288 family)
MIEIGASEMIKNEDMNVSHQIALLVDGENISKDIIPSVLEETSTYGTIAVRRVYADWTRPGMNNWKETLQVHAIQPVQQFAYTTGKNATDSALIIEAMDLLHTGRFHAFCIVSSDSDYTRLATRIREQGLQVIGIGEQKTPRSLVNACSVFVYVENLSSEPQATKPAKRKQSSRANPPAAITDLVAKAFEMTVREDGWADLAAVGNQLHSIDPGFDSRTYGHKRLLDLIKSLDAYEARYSNPEGPGTVFIRAKLET